jgi:ATP-dependent protease ClpP protease subunit
MKLRAWYRIEAKADDEVADLFIFDEIGRSFWDDETVTAKDFIADLRALPDSVKTLRVHVNSPGGDPFDATAIANALRAQSTEKKRTVEVSIEGLAASAATIITSAGDSIRIADNALMMVHNPWGIEMGDANAMRAMAEALDRIRDSIVATYRWVSDLSVEAIQELMNKTTWMSAEQAVKNGFATEIVEGVQAAATFRPEVLARLAPVPEDFRARLEALTAKPGPAPDPSPADPAAVVKACKEAGFPELADDLLALPMAQVTARLDQAKTDRAAAQTYATEVRALCTKAKLPFMAEGYLAAKAPLDVVRAQLTTLTAVVDKVEIDAHLKPDQHTRGAAPIDTAAIYAARNKLHVQNGKGADS